MSDFQQRDNSGSLFTNQRKVKDTHPDFNGSVMIGGVEYFVSGWKKVARTGKTFISMAFTPKEKEDAFDLGDSKPAVQGPVADTDDSGDLPF